MDINMEHFIPFGVQYYRAPTPEKSQWEKDLGSIAKSGFNTVKFWAQWRWNNPSEGKYDFSDLDRLMDIAGINGLKVIINVIFDVAPAWFYKKHPGSVMITCDGRRVEPQVTAWRQAGGAPGPCYHHEEGINIRDRFLEETVQRYKSHPALYVWDLWNEPELTCGILREPVQKDMVCYCETCMMKFKLWLKNSYQSIDRLNSCWGRNYADFEEIEAPRDGGTFKDMVDWRVFFSQTLTSELKRRVEITKEHDCSHPVMVHTVPPPWFNAVNACNNDYELAELVDMFGNSGGNHPFPAVLAASAAPGKQVICAEIHAIGGDTYGRPVVPTFEKMKSYILVPLAHGLKGFMFWQYRAEILGREAPAWGLTALDGGSTPWLEDAQQICSVIRENAELISSVNPVPSDIAIINSHKNSIFDWCASQKTDILFNSVTGLFNAIYDSNLNADILGVEQMNYEKLKQYRVIFYPFPYYMEKKTTDLLRRWVKEGGCLISEAFFAGILDEAGTHSEVLPGGGFTEVFGVSESLAVTAASFANAYDKQWTRDAENKLIPIILAVNTEHLLMDSVVKGYYFQEELLPAEAKVLGRFHNGAPAITVNVYGNGKAIMIGSLLGYQYANSAAEELRALINYLLLSGSPSQLCQITCLLTVCRIKS